MPIENQDLYRNFRVYESTSTLQDVLKEVDEANLIVVVRLPGGKFACVRLGAIRDSVQGFSRLSDRNAMLHAPLGDLLASFASDAIDQNSMELWQAKNLKESSLSKCLVVTSQGQIVGLLTEKISAPVVRRGEPFSFSGGVLSGAAEPEPGASPTAEPAKFINVQLSDQNDRRIKPEEEPLQLKDIYTLTLLIAEESSTASIVQDVLLKYKWASEEQEVILTVRLESDDFEIQTEPQKIKVPRSGMSNKARFDLKPKKAGPGVVNVLLFKEDIFIQLLTLKFTIVDGSLFSQEVSGRTLSAAFTVQPRSLSMTILGGEDGFQLIMTGAVAALAKLPITKDLLALKIRETREVLRKDVVYLQDPRTRQNVLQQQIDIPPETRDLALQRLAEVGYRLYQDIFYSADADTQANLLGDRLRELARADGTLKIQIFSQHFMMPWGLLYMAKEDEYDPADIHTDWFLGFKHIIEHIPLQQQMMVTDNVIDASNGLTVSLNVNKDIDADMRAPLVGSQVDYWTGVEKEGNLKLVQRTSSADLINALRVTKSTEDQIFYFYCHAVSKDLEEGGPDSSTLVISRTDKISLKDLKLQASQKLTLPGEPLVFINACESAELSPLFYDGFVPYFLAKGARGVIGTECETPALFAVEWAKRFFDRLLKGESVGEIALSLRQEFLHQHNNVLGLLYALYVDGDTRVSTN